MSASIRSFERESGPTAGDAAVALPPDARERLRSLIRAHALVTDTRRIHTRTEDTWFLDLRTIALVPEALDIVTSAFWRIFAVRQPCQVAGLELGAVPLVGAILQKASQLGIEANGLIVRKSASKSGLNKVIEGIPNGNPVIVVDDILHSGISLEKVYLALAEVGQTVEAAFVVADFESPRGRAWRQGRNVAVHSLVTLADFDLPIPRRERLSGPTVGTFDEIWCYRHPIKHDLSDISARSSPILWRDRLAFGTSSGDFVCLSAADGALLWQHQAHPQTPKGIRSSPAVVGNLAVYGSYDGCVYAIDMESGDIGWRNECAEYIGSSPAVAEGLGLIFIGLEREVPGRRGALAALEIGTGRLVWEVETENYLHATPAHCAANGVVVIGTNDRDALCVDAASGTVRWRRPIGGMAKMAPAIDADRGIVCLGAMDGGFYGLDLRDGTEKFVHMAESGIYATPLIVEGRAFYPSTDRSFYVVDLASGDIVARLNSRARSFSSPTLIDGGVVFGNNAGLIFDIDPKTLELRARHQITDRIASKAAFDPTTEFIFVHTIEDRIYALRRGARPEAAQS